MIYSKEIFLYLVKKTWTQEIFKVHLIIHIQNHLQFQIDWNSVILTISLEIHN